MTMLSKVLATTLPFYSDCVGWPREYLDTLRKIRDDGEDISRSEFLAHVNWTLDVPPADMIPEDDQHISYKRYDKIYFFIHSAIEYVFAKDRDIEAIQEMLDRENSDPDGDSDSYDFYVKSERESGNRMFVLNRRKLLQGTDSIQLLQRALKDSDSESVRIAKKRLEELQG